MDLHSISGDDLANANAKKGIQLKEFWCFLVQVYPCLVREPWLLLFLLLQTTSVSQGVHLFLLSKQKAQIGWMPRMTCVLLGQRQHHNFTFLLKTSNNKQQSH